MASDLTPMREAALALSFFLGSINRPVRLPPPEFTPAQIWRGSDRAIIGELGLRPSEYKQLAAFRKRFSVAPVLRSLSQLGIEYVARGEEPYPARLSQIHDPPPGLFIHRENHAAAALADVLNGTHIAIVGARSASRYGLDAASMLAGGLSRASVCVISGMALGVDAAAHRGAIAAAGRTIAVLGCGADVVYPAANRKLYWEIAAAGAVISEYPPGTGVMPWRFPARNRIIAGLSRAVVVVEAREKSGALITADFCLDQGGEVCAVPGSIFSELSRGPHRLIREGAAAVSSAADILDLLGLAGSGPEAGSSCADSSRVVAENALNGSGLRVFKSLQEKPLTIDELALKSGIDGRETAAALLALEIKGLARMEPGLGYSLAPAVR